MVTTMEKPTTIQLVIILIILASAITILILYSYAQEYDPYKIKLSDFLDNYECPDGFYWTDNEPETILCSKWVPEIEEKLFENVLINSSDLNMIKYVQEFGTKMIDRKHFRNGAEVTIPEFVNGRYMSRRISYVNITKVTPLNSKNINCLEIEDISLSLGYPYTTTIINNCDYSLLANVIGTVEILHETVTEPIQKGNSTVDYKLEIT